MDLQTRGVEFRYNTGWNLGPLDLQVPANCVTALIGPNGAGKTTLLRILAGFIVPRRGEILLGGKPVKDRTELFRRVRWVAADPAFPTGATVREVAEIALRGFGLDGPARSGYLRHLEGLLQRPLHIFPKALSRGQRLLLALELAFASEPEVLVADEPWNALDPLARASVLEQLEGLAKRGVAVFISSHDIFALPEIASNFCFLAEGQLRWCGALEVPAATKASGQQPQELLELYRRVMEGKRD
ncbi:MAG: ATP-binding cassette domain-containing protein [Acidobacteriota bacterium]